MWLNTTVPAASGAVKINYTHCCVNITSYTANTTLFEDVGVVRADGQLNVGFTHWGGWMPANQPAGRYHLGDLTIECCSGDCMADLLFVGCELYDWYGFGPAGQLPFVTTNGTFTCGAGAQPQCLGTCYVGTCDGELVGEVGKMNCSECLKETGRVWHPNMDAACFGDMTPSDLCLDWCPECCDGDDDDTDTDYPADGDCRCGLDPSEAVPMNPIPELPTFLLTSLGILSLVLLTRKRD